MPLFLIFLYTILCSIILLIVIHIKKMLSTPLERRQAIIFLLGWVAYASTYLLRKPVGVVKADLESELSIPKTQLGWLDTALLLPYAVMQMLLGPVGDKFGPRKTIGFCLILSGLSMASFGHWSSINIFMFLLFLNGTAQAPSWPNFAKSLGAWYPDHMRNIMFGVFGTSSFGGGILGSVVAVYLQSVYGWRNMFLIPSLIVGGIGVLVLLFFQQPSEVGITVPGKDASETPSKTSNSLPWYQVLKIPMIPEVAIAQFSMKVVRYCLYMWLPLYLLHQLNYPKLYAGIFTAVYETGGILGSATIGFIIDRFCRGKPLLGSAYFAMFSAASLLLFQITSTWGIAFNIIFLFLTGMFNCGPDSILGGSIPAELGEMDGRNAAAATVGLVNGFGTTGTFMEGPIIGFVTTQFGWPSMFYVLIGLSCAATLSICRALYIQRRLRNDTPEATPSSRQEV